MIHSKPSRIPMTSMPSTSARMVAAAITLLMPGAGPPPTRIASFLGCVTAQSCLMARNAAACLIIAVPINQASDDRIFPPVVQSSCHRGDLHVPYVLRDHLTIHMDVGHGRVHGGSQGARSASPARQPSLRS